MNRRDMAAVGVLIGALLAAIVQAWTVPAAGSGAVLLVGVAVILAALISESGQTDSE